MMMMMKREADSSVALSVMQQRMWFMETMLKERTSFNLCAARRLVGRLDVAALERALTALVARHPALRTTLRAVDDDAEAVQQVQPEHALHLQPIEDLRELPEPDRQRRLDRRLGEIAREPINFPSGPLFQCLLIRLADDEHLLLFKIHHIVFDGWSMGVILRDLGQLYALSLSGAPAVLPALALRYADFAATHHALLAGETAQRHIRHWATRLQRLGEPLALPADHPRPRHPTNTAGTITLSVDRAATDRLRDLAVSEGTTLFTAVLAAYFLFLYKSTGQTDLVVGVPVHGRRDFPEFHDVVGLFVNTIAVRIDVRPAEPFRDLLRRLGAMLRQDLAHAHAPLEEVIREVQIPRDVGRSPVYQAFFSFQDIRTRTSRWEGLQLEHHVVPITGIAEDVSCTMTERPDGLAACFAYSLDLFSTASAVAFSERYQQLLTRLSDEVDVPLEALSIRLESERTQLDRWNQTAAAYDTGSCVHQLIGRQAALRVGAPAAQMHNTTVSYGELEARSNRLAHLLRARGIGRGMLVGLCVERSLQMIVAQLAVLKAGAAYVPLDPAYPVNRLTYMADDAQLALLITEAALQQTLTWPAEQSVLIDADAAVISGQPDDPLAPDPARDARPDDAAYVIYTSGSTGKPKGVMVPHRAVVNFLASMAREPGLDASARLVAVTTLSFDIAVLELLLPLSVGAQIILAGRDETTDGHALRALIESTRATVLQATPATWRMLIDAGWSGSREFKALIGGEGLPQDLAQQLLERSGELWNMYGPTETTVWSTCWKVDAIEHGISIGRPIANTRVHVLDERRQPCPIGVPGELYIGGDGVTLGYLNRPELTAERFLPDPFDPGSGGRMYRTGDRARWRHDGLLEHLGRLDFQVKVRGHRIELGEIESNLATHPQVARSVVIVREDRPGDVRLVAYVVARGAMPSASELRAHLRSDQPEYTLPQHFIELDAVPLLPNGKIDRDALPPPADDSGERAASYEPPRTATEAAMAEIWQLLLGIAQVSVTDDFFDLGGHSMLAMRLVAQIHQRFNRKLPLMALLDAGTVRQLSAALDRPEIRNSLVQIRAGTTGRPPVFLVHDGIGETLLYRTLAYGLDAGHAVYGLQPRSEDGHTMLHSRIPDMVAYHIDKIRSVQAQGPYLLGGLCAGGVIAFEIARELQAQGESVGLVALIDAADAASETHRGQLAGKRLRRFVGAFKSEEPVPPLRRVAAGATKAARKIWNLLTYEARSLLSRPIIAAKLRLLRLCLDRQRTPPAFLKSLTVAQVYQYALGAETMRTRFEGDVALFRATAGNGAADDEPYVEVFSDPLLGWGRHVRGAVCVFDIPGGHTSMLQEPNVHILAQHMQAWIDAALDPTGASRPPASLGAPAATKNRDACAA